MTVGNSDSVADRFEEAMFFDISFLIADEGMTMGEGTSFNILT
jgi:hypothetical protein